jgi:hypothetical protein
MDIVSLFTNIPIYEALVAIADHLRSDEEMTAIGPYILKLVELCLHNTNFKFNGEHNLYYKLELLQWETPLPHQKPIFSLVN